MLEELAGDEGVADNRVHPALLTLLHDQAALFDATYGDEEYDLRGGFESHRQLIEWYQSAAVRTLGNIGEEWRPEDCVLDGMLISATVEPFDIDDDAAREYRRVLENTVVHPACNDAYSTLRESAVDYSKGEDAEYAPADFDPREQRSVAMRPGFASLDEQQSAALDELWGGFEDRDALSDWLHSLNSPAHGEMDDDISAQIMLDETALDHLVYDTSTETAKRYRVVFAATILIPRFVDAVRAIDVHEMARTASEGPTTMRAKGAK